MDYSGGCFLFEQTVPVSVMVTHFKLKLASHFSVIEVLDVPSGIHRIKYNRLTNIR